jgi:uncharacterized protein (DUF2141 family)
MHLRTLILASLLLTPLRAAAADLEVEVTDLTHSTGRVRVAVWASAATFLKDPLRQAELEIPANAKSVRVRFSDVPAGPLAASAYQDLNRNQKLDTGFAGIPKEPYGFSNGARGRFGPASFDDAAVKFTAPLTKLEIKLK